MVLACAAGELARAGQVLASALVRELAGEDTDLRFGEAREVSLPGLAGRMAVHEVRWGERRRQALRVVIADDAALVRDGVAALLRDHGVEVAATASDAAELHEEVARHLPDVALVDIRMPPTFTDEGLVAAERIRAALSGGRRARPLPAPRRPLRAARGARQPCPDGLPAQGPRDRLARAVRRARADRRGGLRDRCGGRRGLVTRASALARIDELTEREREVLALVAEGLRTGRSPSGSS